MSDRRRLYVFRSDHADVIATFDEAERIGEERHAAALAFAREVDPTRERRLVVGNSMFGRHFVGLEHQGEWPVPRGWRIKQGDGPLSIVPRLNSKTGKTADERMKTMDPPNLRRMLPGMPAEVWTAGHVYVCGVRRREGAVWVTWAVDPDSERDLDTGEPSVDRLYWAPVKLSEFYAMVESDPAWNDEHEAAVR